MVIGSPVLNLTMGDTNLEAPYVSGSATDTLTFTCEMDEEAFGIVNAAGIKEGSGTIENIHNGAPESITGMVADLTVIPHSSMEASASSEHTGSTEGPARLAIDDNPATWWHTHYGAAGDGVLPQSLTIKLDQAYVIDRYSYLSRGAGGNGGVKGYELQISLDGETWYPVATGELKDSSNTQEITFDPVNAQYVRLVVNSSYGNQPNMFASAAEINIYRSTENATEVDKDALETAVNAAEDILEEYCESGYDELEAALANANEALQDENVTQKAVDIYTEALNAAIEAIVYKGADKSALTTAVSTYGSVDLNLIADGAEEYTAALEAAQATLNNEALDIRDQADIDAAKEALETAYNALVYTAANTEALSAAVKECAVDDITLYTEATAQGYTTALNAAKDLLDDETLDIRDQAEIDAAVTALQTAYGALAYKPADTADLEAAVTDCAVADTSLYTEATLTAYTKALEAAQALLGDETLDIRDQADINAAATALETAYNALSYKPADTADLEAAVTDCAVADTSLYTEATLTAYTEALEAAQALLEDEALDIRDQADINAAAAALETAYNALSYKPADTAALEAAVADCAVADTSLYTDDSLAAYREALEAAQALLKDETLDIRDQSDIDAAESALETAFHKLVYKEANLEALQERYEAAAKVDMDKLTDASRKSLENAMAEAKALLDIADELDIRDQQAIEDALNELTAALANLDEKPAEEKPSDGNKPEGTDGKTDTADKDKAVKTGDTAEFGWMILMLAVSMSAAVVVLRRRSGKN